MVSLIGFGRWNKYYYYILISAFTRFIKDDILGLNADYPIIAEVQLSHHPIMTLLLGYSSDLIISFIFLLYIYNKKNKQQMNSNDIEKEIKTFSKNNSLRINTEYTIDSMNFNNNNLLEMEDISKSETKFELIHTDIAEIRREIVSKNSQKFIFISAGLILLKEIFIKLVYSANDIFDYYFLNLIIIVIILRFFFKEKIYRHQKLSIILVILISGSCLISCIFAGDNDDNPSNDNSKNIFVRYQDKVYIIFILIIVYIIISISFCTGIILQKNIMHFNFVSSQKILFWKGLIGVGLCIIGLIISSTVPCNNQTMEIPPEEQNDGQGPPPDQKPPGPKPPGPKPPGPEPEKMSDNTTTDNFEFDMFYCFDNYENSSYLDNFLSYFTKFSEPDNNQNNTNNTNIYNEDNSKSKIVKEVFISLGYFIFHYISELSLILVNKFLTPIHYLISESLYNLIHIPYIIITKDYYENHPDDPFIQEMEENQENLNNNFTKNITTRILKLVAVFFELLGYLIYMEIIQLNFCGINRNVAKNIQKRAKTESDNRTYSEDSLSDSSDDEK